MKTYDDNERMSDAEILAERDKSAKMSVGGGGGVFLHDALAVFLLDPKLRPVLEALDPQAVTQARRAMLLL